MIRRPPRSTLFPYTRSSDLSPLNTPISPDGRIRNRGLTMFPASSVTPNTICVLRSEEHTSELQSRLHLGCRLLLEKKNDHRLYMWTTRDMHFRITPLTSTSR